MDAASYKATSNQNTSIRLINIIFDDQSVAYFPSTYLRRIVEDMTIHITFLLGRLDHVSGPRRQAIQQISMLVPHDHLEVFKKIFY